MRSGMILRQSLRLTGRLSRRKGKTGVRVAPAGTRPGFNAGRQTNQFQRSFVENVNKSATRNSPFALMQKSPVAASGLVSVRKGKGITMFGGWDRYFAELRGSNVLLYPESHAAIAGNGSTHALTDMEAHLVGLFSAAGCVLSRKGKDLVKLKRDGISVMLKFESEASAGRWAAALRLATGQRVARISDFEMIAAIGKGAGGKVFLARDKRTGERLALKSIAKDRITQSSSAFRHAVDERLLLEMTASHPFFVQLRYAFQTRKYFYLVTEFCEGGDLYFYMFSHQSGLTEKEARIVCAEVLLALEHLHKLGFIYRDLKPENILLDAEGHVRLADFGLCKHFPGGTKLARTSTICGTHAYVAPEMLTAKYGRSVDSWAIGVFLYHIVVGRPPFEARNLDEVEQNLKGDQDIYFYEDIMSENITNFITSLLERDPLKRLGCQERGLLDLREHDFLRDLSWSTLEQRKKHRDGLKIMEGDMDAFGSITDESLLRNFDLTEWRHVSLDEDFDDPSYGQLWPPLGAEELWRVDNSFLIGFEYSAPPAL